MILACGEALIDMLPRTTVSGEEAFAPYAGGAVFNTAIALGRLDVPTGFFSGLSTDLFGDILRRQLAGSQVDSGFAHLSDRPTTLAFVRLLNGQATYAFYDENTAGRMLTVTDLPQTVTADALFFGGISLVAEPCGSTLEALMHRVAPDHVTMIDPNIRPGFITDAVGYRARIERMTASADIVKLSDEDLHWLMGPGDLPTLARGLVAQGPKLVCITEGAKGATGYTAAHEVFVAATPVAVADTVGAGDTFNAGVLASLHRQGALSKDRIAVLDEAIIAAALGLGVRAAAITVSRPGANPPWTREM